MLSKIFDKCAIIRAHRGMDTTFQVFRRPLADKRSALTFAEPAISDAGGPARPCGQPVKCTKAGAVEWPSMRVTADPEHDQLISERNSASPANSSPVYGCDQAGSRWVEDPRYQQRTKHYAIQHWRHCANGRRVDLTRRLYRLKCLI